MQRGDKTTILADVTPKREVGLTDASATRSVSGY